MSCNWKNTKLLDCVVKGICAVIGLNMVGVSFSGVCGYNRDF